MVEYRFECVHCGHRIHATGEDSDAARQVAREQGTAHVNEAHADRLREAVHLPDELAPDDVLSGEAAYGSLRGWLAPTDDLLVCVRCGFFFESEDQDADRAPVGDAGLVCTACHERQVEDHEDSVAKAIEDFVR